MEETKFYGLRNDYLFRALMQESELTLRGLLSALLDIPMKDIKECVIENPIELGKDIDRKTCVLDVKILLNNRERINVEVQVRADQYWTGRSLVYWSRMFDTLKTGEDYDKLQKTYHIGILDFDLFPERKEFFGKYQILNTYSHEPYTDLLDIRVLCLNNIAYARTEDYASKLVYWAKIFKATTWEELNQILESEELSEEESEVFQDMTLVLKKLTEEEKIKMQLDAAEDYERRMRGMKRYEREEGRKEGIQEGEARVNTLMKFLLEEGRTDALARSVSDEAYQQKLFEEYGL